MCQKKFGLGPKTRRIALGTWGLLIGIVRRVREQINVEAQTDPTRI